MPPFNMVCNTHPMGDRVSQPKVLYNIVSIFLLLIHRLDNRQSIPRHCLAIIQLHKSETLVTTLQFHRLDIWDMLLHKLDSTPPLLHPILANNFHREDIQHTAQVHRLDSSLLLLHHISREDVLVNMLVHMSDSNLHLLHHRLVKGQVMGDM